MRSRGLGVGFTFQPTDQELLTHYLYNKVHRLPYLPNAVMDFNLYGPHEPWSVFELFGGADGDVLYFFCKLKRSRPGDQASRINRRVGTHGGRWSGENYRPVFFSSTSTNPIGVCRRFRYENDGVEHHGEWLMFEYSLDKLYMPYTNAAEDEYVLCQLRKNPGRGTKALKRKRCQSEISTSPSPSESDQAIVKIFPTTDLRVPNGLSNANQIQVEKGRGSNSDVNTDLLLDFALSPE